jgi:hypothetical protein
MRVHSQNCRVQGRGFGQRWVVRQAWTRILCASLGLMAAWASITFGQVTTYHYDNNRTGANPNETILNTSNVNQTQFGKLFSMPVVGQIYAQPLYVPNVTIPQQGVHNVLYVATEHNNVYAYDADAPGSALWQVNMGPSMLVTTCCMVEEIQPEVGILSTPVIDTSSGTLYVVAETSQNDAQKAHFQLHALDITTGADKLTPAEITGSVPGTSIDSVNGLLSFGFNPNVQPSRNGQIQHFQRPGLLLLNGNVYIAFGSHQDNTPYHGWLFSYSASSLQQTGVICFSPNGQENGVWQGGVGLAADGGGNIYLETGNGPFDVNAGGSDFGDSIVKIATTGGMHIVDYFTPSTQQFDQMFDWDLGSSGPVLIPGTNLGMAGGKDGMMYVFNTSNLGQFSSTTDRLAQEWQATFAYSQSLAGGFWGGNYIFYNNTMYGYGERDFLKAFAFNGSQFNPTPTSTSTVMVPSAVSNDPGMVVSANGTVPGTAIVWASFSATGQANGLPFPGVLYAFDASDVSKVLWSSNQNSARDYSGAWGKWSPPTVVNGKVYLATFDNLVNVYGLLPAIAATAGTPQSTTVNTVFGTGLQVTVTAAGQPTSGVTVTFTAPSSGVTANFAGSATATAVTNASGIATAPALTANGQLGNYTVTATAPGTTTPASFSLTNVSGTPSTITATAGTPQGAAVTTAFATALQATVKDSNNNLLSNVPVTFTAPSTGAGASFGGSVTAVVMTNASGIAVAPALTANAQAGTYSVTASVAGVTGSASFSLTNTSTTGKTGSLSGSGNSSATTFSLTTEGTADWVHWGETPVNRKNGVTAQLSDYTLVGSGTVLMYTNDSRALSWTDGAPTPTASNNNGTYIDFVGNGFSFSSPADANARILNVHVGGFNSGGTFTAHLSDSSAADYVDSTALVSGAYDRNYTLAYTAASPGQTLTISWVTATGGGNVTLSGAALSLGGPAIAAGTGTPQSATVNTAFGAGLQATVTSGGSPISGIVVTFTAPGAGASASFGGSATATAVSDFNGIVTVPAPTANAIAGTYSVMASAVGVATPANFSLTNLPGPPSTITASAGTPESASLNTAFGTALQAIVQDANGNPLNGIGVTFAAPGSAPTGTFGGSATAVASTNASGVATAPVFTANGQTGTFTVIASAAGVATTASFNLTILSGVPASVIAVAGTPQSATVNTTFGALQALVKDTNNNPLSGFTVNFATPGTGPGASFMGFPGATAITNASGIATAPTLTANNQAGTYAITASVAGVATTANFSLANTPTSTGGGALSGSVNTASTTANLTQEGSSDWVHWGIAFGAPGLKDRKSGVTAQISNYTQIGTLQLGTINPDARTLTWTDGTNSTTGSDVTAVYIDSNSGHAGNGFTLTVPADTATRTLILHLGGQDGGGMLTAALSDLSATAYQDTSVTQSGKWDRNYTLSYKANAAGQTLTVTWVSATASGNVSLAGAALSLAGSSTNPAAITATAGTLQSVPVNTAYGAALQATVVSGSNAPMSGVTVTFTAPSTGPTGTFGGSATATAVTNASGVATATGLTANGQAGSFTVTASTTGVATSATFSLTNLAGAPASIAATAGTPQSQNISVAVGTALQAVVKDAANNLLSGVTVTFAAPATGASALFGGSATATAVTNASGVATAPALTANGVAGTYTVTAGVAGLIQTGAFSLTNLAGAPAAITATAGTPQSAVVSVAFTTALQATVKDAGNNPVSGVTVTFTAPGSSASASFGGSATATAVTNASGIAIAPALTANGVPGTYTVTAGAAGVATTAAFSLTNLSGTPASITAMTGTPQSTPVSTAFTTALQAVVKDSGNNPLSGVTVTFAVPGTGASAALGGSAAVVTNASGIATAPALTANSQPGTYAATASVAGVATAASFSLTNTPVASGGGSLTGSLNSASTAANLTLEGSSDWVHWGIAFGAPGLQDRKRAVTAQISNYTVIGTLALGTINPDARTLSWTDGTNHTTGSDVTGVYIDSNSGHAGNGFSITVPADTTSRTLVLHFGVQNGGGTLTASLSDLSASPYQSVDTSQTGKFDRNFALVYNAGSPGQTLTVTWVSGTASGNVSIAGAALSLTSASSTPAAITASAGTPQSVAVNTAYGTALQATVMSASNTPVSGVTVTFTAPSTGATASFGGSATAPAVTNASGIANAPALTANGQIGAYTVTASTAGVATNATFSLTNTVGAPASIASTAGTPQSGNINVVFGTALQAVVKDAANNLLSGKTVTFTAPSTGASARFNGSATATAVTNASGIATAPALTATAQAGAYTVTAGVAGVATTASFNLTNLAGAPAAITATVGTPQSTTVSTAFTTALQATVQDVGSNPVSGVTVTFTAPNTGAFARFNGSATATAVTNASGIATAPALTANGVAGAYTVTAGVAGVGTTAPFSLTNLSGTPASITATTGTPQSATVNAAFATALQATVKDGANNLLSGVTVTFTAPTTGAFARFSGSATATAVTNATGVATAPALTANAVAGGYTVTASVTGVATLANYSLTNLAGAPAAIIATVGTPQSATVNAAFATALQATVKDAGANPLSGVTVTFTSPNTGAFARFSGAATATAVTNASGIATAPALTANGVAGTYTVTASVAGLGTTASFSLTNLNGTPASITPTAGTPQSATVSTAFTTALQAVVKDASNNPLSGVSVTFAAPGSGASAAFGGSATVVTNSSGIAAAPALTANAQAGSYTVTASAAGVATPASYSLTNSAATTTGGSLSGVGNSLTTTANLTAEGTADWIHWGDSVLNRKAGVTAQISNYTVVGSGPVNGYSNDPRALSWTDGAPTPSGSNNNGSYINFTGNGFSFTVPADTSPRNLTVHLGGWASGARFTAHLSDGSAPDFVDSTTPPSGQYDRNYALTYNASSAGQTLKISWVLISSAGNVTLNGAALSLAGPSITASAGTPQSATVGAAFSTGLQATVMSAGTPVSGVTVTFTAPSTGATGNFSGSATAITDASGIATAPTFTANGQAGSYTVTASAAGTATPASFSLTNLAGAPAGIAATVGTPQSAALSTAFSTALQTTVKDAGNNPLSGVTVTFTAPATGASARFSGSATATAVTNASGIATAPALTANGVAGSYTLTASVAGLGTTASFSLTNLSGTPASVTAAGGTPQSATVSSAFGTALQAVVKDSGNNLLSGVTVTFTAPASGASASFGGSATATAVTNASGIAAAPALTANAQAGSYTVAASVAGVATSASFSLTNLAGAPASVTATGGTPQTATTNTAFGALQAVVKDAANNVLSGVTVTFTAPASGASAAFGGSATATSTTNASGIATAPTLTANGQTGTYAVTASVAGVATPASFSLTNSAAVIAPIKLIQQAKVDSMINVQSITVGFGSANKVGNWIGVAIFAAQASNHTFTVTDTNGNIYHPAVTMGQTAESVTMAIYYAENIKAGANTVKVVPNSAGYLRVVVLEYSGIATSNSLDVTAAAQGNSISPNSGTVTTTANGDLLLGVSTTADAAVTAGSGYTLEQLVPLQGTRLTVEDQIQNSAGPASATLTLGATKVWTMGLAAFKKAQ